MARALLKTTFDMTTLIFSTRGCPSYPFYSFQRGPWYPFFVASDRNPSSEVATKDHFTSNPRKGNPPDLKTKVDVSKVDVKGFPNNAPNFSPILSPSGKSRLTSPKLRGEQKAPENATHPKTQLIDRSENLRFRVCCVSGALCSPLRGRQNTPENATHSKTQILGTVDYLRKEPEGKNAKGKNF